MKSFPWVFSFWRVLTKLYNRYFVFNCIVLFSSIIFYFFFQKISYEHNKHSKRLKDPTVPNKEIIKNHWGCVFVGVESLCFGRSVAEPGEQGRQKQPEQLISILTASSAVRMKLIDLHKMKCVIVVRAFVHLFDCLCLLLSVCSVFISQQVYLLLNIKLWLVLFFHSDAALGKSYNWQAR